MSSGEIASSHTAGYTSRDRFGRWTYFISSCRCSCGVRLTASRFSSIFLIHELLQRKVEKVQDVPDISDLGFHDWTRC